MHRNYKWESLPLIWPHCDIHREPHTTEFVVIIYLDFLMTSNKIFGECQFRQNDRRLLLPNRKIPGNTKMFLSYIFSNIQSPFLFFNSLDGAPTGIRTRVSTIKFSLIEISNEKCCGLGGHSPHQARLSAHKPSIILFLAFNVFSSLSLENITITSLL